MAKAFNGKSAGKYPAKPPVKRVAPKYSKGKPDAVRGNQK